MNNSEKIEWIPMMDDLISRHAAIDAIVNTVSEIGLHDNSEVARYGATFRQHEIIDIIEGIPSAQPEPRWIPVKELLPEKDGMYFVSISQSSGMEKRIYTDFYSHFGIWQIFGKFVTAWMPLPEPYREETDDVPERNVEKLTDREQRIFLAAMGREEKVCKQVDDECKYFTPPYDLSLVKVCKEITRKVKKVLWT